MDLKTKIAIGMAICGVIYGALIWFIHKMQDADR